MFGIRRRADEELKVMVALPAAGCVTVHPRAGKTACGEIREADT